MVIKKLVKYVIIYVLRYVLTCQVLSGQYGITEHMKIIWSFMS